jgi:hypothetical protein
LEKKSKIIIIKKNLFFEKLLPLLKIEGFNYKLISNFYEISKEPSNKKILFFYIDSEKSILDFKRFFKDNFEDINFFIFKRREFETKIKQTNVTIFLLPLVFNDLILVLKRVINFENEKNNIKKIGDYFFNPKTFQLSKEDYNQTIDLTELENKLLSFLLKKKNGASKSEILSSVWQHNRDLKTHTLESLIYRLRKKIEKDPNKPKILINDERKYFVKI